MQSAKKTCHFSKKYRRRSSLLASASAFQTLALDASLSKIFSKLFYKFYVFEISFFLKKNFDDLFFKGGKYGNKARLYFPAFPWEGREIRK